ncbi:MAG: twin transmembrane helix small protein [Gammaproteobacteria bacterium]|nr:twin transmembrane helix small protein [Gammaproteobacteria bacterium]
MLVKIAVIGLLLVIVGSLGSGLFFMMRDRGKSHRTVRALTWRIGLSLAAFALLMIGAATGLITPHGIAP